MKVSPWLVAVIQLALAALTHGHGFLKEPRPRNVRDGEYCPQCGNGFGVCGHRPGGQWGETPVYLDVFDGVQETYTADEIVEFKVTITAHHKGHFEFSICDRRINSSMSDPNECLSHWKLLRVDPIDSYGDDCLPANDPNGDCQPLDARHPERWYLPPKASSTEEHKMRYRIPHDLQCSECTLQWRWWTANSCTPAEDYGCYFDELAQAGWNAAEWCGAFCGNCPSSGLSMGAPFTQSGCGEEFRNCADIRVVAGSPTPPSPDPAPSPPVPVPTPTTASPNPAPTPIEECVPHSVLTCINDVSTYWPKCDPAQNKEVIGPDGYEYGHYCTEEWSTALNEMLGNPVVNKCEDREAKIKVVAQIAYETAYFSTVYQPRDGGAGLVHMIPANWLLNADDMDELWPGNDYARLANDQQQAFFQNPLYGWRSVAAWYKRTNRVIAGCHKDLFDESFDEQTRCILASYVDRSEVLNTVSACFEQVPTQAPNPTTTEPESEPEDEECTAMLGPGAGFGATDERCTLACSMLPAGSWPCQPGDMCLCSEASTVSPTPTPTEGPPPTPLTQAPTPSPTQAPSPMPSTQAPIPVPTEGPAPTPTTQVPTPLPTESPAPTPTTQAPTTSPSAATTAGPLPTTTGAKTCLQQKNCDISAWCGDDGYEAYCRDNGALGHCPEPWCYMGYGNEPNLLQEKVLCSGEDCPESTQTAILLQKRATQSLDRVSVGVEETEAAQENAKQEDGRTDWINVCYFTNWARYRSGLINAGKDIFEMDVLSDDSCSHFMYGFGAVVEDGSGSYKIQSNDPNADHPTGSEQQTELCPGPCNDPDFVTDWSDPDGVRCDWPCNPLRDYRGYEGLNVGMKQKNPNIKSLISVGGWNFNECSASSSDTFGQGSATCEIFSTIAASEEKTRKFARNAIDFCRKWGFDGFDLDWEYPVVAGHNSNTKVDGNFQQTPQDYDNYVRMLRIMKEEFQRESPSSPLLLTAAVGVGKSTVETAYNIPGMSQHLDLINLMTYDLHGGWETRTGCNAPLFATAQDQALSGYDCSVSWAVDYWLEHGASASQLTIGLGMYGRGWTLQSPSMNSGFNAPASGKSQPATCTKEAGYMAYYEIKAAMAEGASFVYDEDRQCPYIVSNDEWVGFDDVRSLCAKVEFAKRRGLRGSMLWALDLDDFTGFYSGDDGRLPLVNLAGHAGSAEYCGDSPLPSPVPSPSVPSPPAATTLAPGPAGPTPPMTLAPSPETSVPATTATPSPLVPTPSHPCQGFPGNDVGATDALCAVTCDVLPRGLWPCGEGGPCVCSWDETPPAPPAPPAPTSAPTTAPGTTAGPAPTPPAPPPDGLLDALVKALEDSSHVFEYDTGNGWLPSDIYTWDDMITAVHSMAEEGVGQLKLWIGEGQNHVYGLVNIAAFLAQCMQETIQYNACDENNWSNQAVTQEAGGTPYSATSACGQMSQSYQNYECSAEENDLAGGSMACPVDNDMVIRARTRAGWYGAPPQLFCAPRSKVPKAPRWDIGNPSWCNGEGAFNDDVDLDTYFAYVNAGGGCQDFPGIKAGGWKFTGEGCTAQGCAGSPAPLFSQPEGRTDVEGCCWWGRGVIQSTGVCNYGKLNYYLGKRAADEGRRALFPQIDFCADPGSICADGAPPELKWIAGFFYWLNSVQPYTAAGWDFYEELKSFVDGGLNANDNSFIDGTSGIVNRGCHNPPNCGSGSLHGGQSRRNNFRTILKAMGL